MWEKIGGLVFLVLGAFQLYATYNNFIYLKKQGKKDTSYFVMFSIWSSLVFAIAILTFGILLLFNLI